MPFAVQPVATSDAPGLASVMIDSRWEDEHWRNLFEPSANPKQMTYDSCKRLPWNLINGRTTKRHQKAVDITSGKVVGYARWLLPSTLATAWLEAQVADVDESQRRDFKKDFDGHTIDGQMPLLRMDLLHYRSAQVEEAETATMPDQPYLALDYLSVAPEYQRRGVGSLLLQSGLRAAHECGLTVVYVISEPAGVKLYRNHGFEVIKVLSVEYARFGGKEPAEHYYMIGQSQPSGGP